MTKEQLERILARFKEADDERYKLLMECRERSDEDKRKGDMYGCNFHQGMDAGVNWASLYYFRVQRELEAMLKELTHSAEAPHGK